MDKQRIKTIIYKLRKERQFLETHLLNICKQMPVWITQQYTYCKKGNCKCTKGHPHGPFHYLFFKEGDKVIHRYIPKDKLHNCKCAPTGIFLSRLVDISFNIVSSKHSWI